jgi:ABC-2 type transport system permease protein
VIILVVGLALGAHVHGGIFGWVTILFVAFVVGCCFSGISHAFALMMRREETVIAVANFVGLPLMFLSTMLISAAAMPVWIRHVAGVNPVNWAAEAARAAELRGTDWTSVAEHLALLLGVTALTVGWALLALRRYRASL